MANADLARALFAPESIALVGASGDAAKNTARPLRYLRKHGYAGRVYPVNPSRDEVLGETAYPDLKAATEAAGGAIEHVYVMVPGEAVPGVISECAAAGAVVATIYSDGFAETGAEGVVFQDDMVAMARAGGMRVVGPNSMGVVNVHAGLAMTTNAALEAEALTPGPLSVISQSGTALGALLGRGQARGFGFRSLLSIGNEADVSVGEVIDVLVDDENTGAILLFLETLRHTDAFAAAARRAFEAKKPVIAYKLGRSEAGQEMAVSHSGALAGPDAAADAFLAHHGVIRVDTFEALLEAANLVRDRRPPAGRRVSVMTTTGGGAAMVVDRLGQTGVRFQPPPGSVFQRLIELDIRVGDAPVIDLTMAGARADVYGPVLRDLMAEGEMDAVVCVVGSSAQFLPDVAVGPIIAEAKAAAKGGGKALAVFCVPEAAESLRALADSGIAGFRTPESCADGVRAYLDWRAPAPAVAADAERLERARTALVDATGTLDIACSLELFEALGIPAAGRRVVGEGGLPDGALGDGLSFPVAVKVLSKDIPHKTESGALILGIEDAAALRDAVRTVADNARRANPRAGIAGVLVQSMESGLAEAIVGYRLDAQSGPVVVVGAGGTMTELLDDVAVAVAPVGEAQARAMIESVRGLAPVRGYRGQPKGDLDALAAAVAAVSQLALLDAPAIAEAEINPLIVKAEGGGVVAVDGLVVIGGGA